MRRDVLKNFIRYILFFPVAWIISTIILFISLIFTDIFWIYISLNLIAGFSFVIIGIKIVPREKFIFSLILTGIVFSSSISRIMEAEDYNNYLQSNIPVEITANIFSIIGAIVAVIITYMYIHNK